VSAHGLVNRRLGGDERRQHGHGPAGMSGALSRQRLAGFHVAFERRDHTIDGRCCVLPRRSQSSAPDGSIPFLGDLRPLARIWLLPVWRRIPARLTDGHGIKSPAGAGAREWIGSICSRVFHGRISRQPFWIGVLALAVVETVCQMVAHRIEGDRLGSIVDLAFSYPEFALTLKRAHDRNLPTWWIAALFVGSVLLDFLAVIGVNTELGDMNNPNLIGVMTTVSARRPQPAPAGRSRISPRPRRVPIASAPIRSSTRSRTRSIDAAHVDALTRLISA